MTLANAQLHQLQETQVAWARSRKFCSLRQQKLQV